MTAQATTGRARHLGGSRWAIDLPVAPEVVAAGRPSALARWRVRPVLVGHPIARVDDVLMPPPGPAGTTLSVLVTIANVQSLLGAPAASYDIELGSADGSGTVWSACVQLGAIGPDPAGGASRHDYAFAYPNIDYEARDYDALRTMMLARIEAAVGPNLETNPVAQTVAVVEALAYLGDNLSYAQDAVATESYLATARRRISTTRHARLLDYDVSEGDNARAWVALAAAAGSAPELPRGTRLVTAHESLDSVLIDEAALDAAAAAGARVFETMSALRLYPELNAIFLYFASAADSTMIPGATSAMLKGDYLGLLEPGHPLAIEAQSTGGATLDARVVRLTAVAPGVPDAQGERVSTTVVSWSPEDAIDGQFGAGATVFVARGNVVLADHGRSVPPIGVAGGLPLPSPEAGRRYWPQLPVRDVTFRSPPPGDLDRLPASTALYGPRSGAVPQIELTQLDANGGAHTWTQRRDLLDSGRFATDYVVEVEDDRSVRLRFGDGQYGMAPQPGATFSVRVRIGSGTPGNVGAGMIAHVVGDDRRIIGVANPVAACGGVDPELLSAVRIQAPTAWRVVDRAVTDDDYLRLAGRVPGVGDAQVIRRRFGSTPTAVLFIAPADDGRSVASVLGAVERAVARAQPIGIDLMVRAARALPVEIALDVQVAPAWSWGVVSGALDAAFATQLLGRGRFAFGVPLYASEVVATAAAVEGVVDVQLTTFDALRGGARIAGGAAIRPRPGEIIQVPRDPGTPGAGSLLIRLRGNG